MHAKFPKVFLIWVLILFGFHLSFSQCPNALGDEVSFGNGNWVGYVYDGVNNFNSSNYQGYLIEAEVFDQSFCGNDCIHPINGCDSVSYTHLTLPTTPYV